MGMEMAGAGGWGWFVNQNIYVINSVMFQRLLEKIQNMLTILEIIINRYK